MPLPRAAGDQGFNVSSQYGAWHAVGVQRPYAAAGEIKGGDLAGVRAWSVEGSVKAHEAGTQGVKGAWPERQAGGGAGWKQPEGPAEAAGILCLGGSW